MKAYKIELLVLDFEDVGIEDITIELEQMRYVSASVMSTEEADIGEWSDDHPLNRHDTQYEEYERLFPCGSQSE